MIQKSHSDWLTNQNQSETFLSHHKLYINEHQFTKSISEDHDWKTELKVKISLETINNSKTLISLKTMVSSKAGFIDN